MSDKEIFFESMRVAAERIEQLTSGPGGIMEMKQTISDKEEEISILNTLITQAMFLIKFGDPAGAYKLLEGARNDED
jgi:hypothetical protein